jgi:hypothetical protein
MADPWLEVGDPVEAQAPPPPDDPYAALAEPAGQAAPARPEEPPIIVSAIRLGGSPRSPAALKAAGDEAVKPEEVDPSYTVAGFDGEVAPDTQFHSGLTDADKAEYRGFFKDPKHPPSAAALRQWYHAKTGALLGNADQIVEAFAKTGKFQTNEKIAIPKPKTSAADAYFEHTANAATADYGPEVAAALATLGIGGDGPNIWNADDQTLGNLWANNADLLHARLDAEQEQHPVASPLGELTGVAVDAPLGGVATDAAGLGKLGKAAVTTAESAVYGSGAAGPGNRGEGAVTGAALAAATEAAAPFVAKFVAATKAGNTAAAAAVAKAAHDLGIDLPRFVIGSTKDARKAAALEQSAAGSGTIIAATNKMIDQSEAARDSIAGHLGIAAATDAQLGDQALNAAVAQNRVLRASGRALYDRAKAATAGATIAPTSSLANIGTLLAEENSKIGGSKIAPILQRYRDDLANAGQITIDQARSLRTDLREQLGADASATPDNTDRIVKTVMAGVSNDMANGLTAAGRPDAVALYKEADANWAQQRELEDAVLKPFLGKDFDNWGEDVAKKISADAKGNGTRLARFLNTLPEGDANRVRAGIVYRLGAANKGAQNAAGDAFSLDTFLTNWNELKGSRNLILPKETVQSLDKLAQVAEVAKKFSRKLNRSNTGGVLSYLAHGVPTAVGTGGAIFTHDPHVLAYGLLLSGLGGVKQYGAAKLLASPAFAKKLAATPMNPKAAVAFWARPWVRSLRAKNPAIAAEIQAFQHAFLSHVNDNGIVTSAAASPDAEGQDQNQ